MELTILLPVLNEEETIEACIKQAQNFINRSRVEAEILIADNDSTDNSCEIAKKLNARIIHVKERGYGNALRTGIKEAKGKYIIMADADETYDLENLDNFLSKLREGYELVVGDRFKGGIEKGAMSLSHKIGAPFLSWIGRIVSKSKIKDFHCGIRGLNKEAIMGLELQCEGMEFASEMIVKAQWANLKITQIPTTLKKTGRTRKSHLKTYSDGIRHLKFLLKIKKEKIK